MQPALSTLYNQALGNYFSNTPQYYPGSTIAPESWQTQAARNLQTQRALTGSPLDTAAQGQVLNTLAGNYFQNPASTGLQNLGEGAYFDPRTASGQFLNANPYLDSMFNQAAGNVGRQFRSNVMPGIESAFSQAGRYGSNQMLEGLGQAQQQYGQTLNDLATNIYSGNYAQERGLMEAAQQSQNALRGQAFSNLGDIFGRERAFQTQAAGMAPGLAQTDYANIGMLGQAGASQEARSQAELNDVVNRFNFQQAQPQEKLAFLNQILNGGLSLSGSTSNTSASGGRSPLTGALGGSMLGGSLLPAIGNALIPASLGGELGMLGMGLGPLGMIGGAILGGLFS